MKNPSGNAGALNVDIKYLRLQPDIITDKPPAQTDPPCFKFNQTQPYRFKNYELPEDERGVALYWHWDDYGKTEEICESLGASSLTKSQKGALSRIVMHAHYEALGAGRPIHYSRAKNANLWTSGQLKKRAFFSQHLVVNGTNFLEHHCLIHHNKGSIGYLGRQSEFRATYQLIANIAGISYKMLRPDDPLVLRNAENEELLIPNTRALQRMAKRVDAQNELILNTDFTTLGHLKAPMRRIFRHDMDHLGRFYTVGASWQNIRRETRPLIMLEGQPTTLLDFSACVPNIAYRKIQEIPPGNPYKSDNFCRSDAKLAMVILLNALTKEKAINALAFDMGFAGTCSNDLIARRNEAELLISELELRHPCLVEAGLFFGSGLKLMRIESDIADKIMTDLRNLGIVSLPIHDGFMVKRENKPHLLEAMNEHSKFNSSVSIPVSVEF